jgi:hypothetical protein
MDVTARIDTRVRILSRPDRNGARVDERNDGDLSMQDDDVMTCLSCAATATVREAQHAYNEDRWVPVTPKRRKPKIVWDYTYILRRLRQPGAETVTILYDEDDDLGEAYRLGPKIAVITEIPPCRDLHLYDIVRLRTVPYGTMEKVSTRLQRYYASQHAIYYLPKMEMGNQVPADDRWPRLRQTLGDEGCAVTNHNLVPGYAMVNAPAGVDVAALLAGRLLPTDTRENRLLMAYCPPYKQPDAMEACMPLQIPDPTGPQLDPVAAQFAHWRQQRTHPSERIPQALWDQAVALTRERSYSHVAKQ